MMDVVVSGMVGEMVAEVVRSVGCMTVVVPVVEVEREGVFDFEFDFELQ